MRVPIGSSCLLISTAALRSKRIALPSPRRTGNAVRTITAWCTSPFFTLPRGIASLMDTTMMSPTEAVLRFEPPSTLMHCTRRAPELSATSRLVSTEIMPPLLRPALRRAAPAPLRSTTSQVLRLLIGAALLDAHRVADLAQVRFVMRRVLLRAADELLVQRMHDATIDQDRDGLVHLVARHPPCQDALWHSRRSPYDFAAERVFSAMMVFTRAISRRTCRTRPDAFLLPGGTLEAQVELLLAQIEQHRAQLVRRLRPHIGRLVPPSCVSDPGDEPRRDRQLRRAQRQRLARQIRPARRRSRT